MTDVVIIGGGPVGLLLATLLLQHGVTVRVLEQRSAPDPHSRAIGIHPPGMAALATAGVAADLIGEGIRIRRGYAVAGGRTLARMSFDGVSPRFPYVLAVPQARTGEVLERRVRELDPDALHRGVRLTGLHDDGDRVRAGAESGRGPLQYTASLVVAADGVRSTVRDLVSPALVSRDYPDRYLMGDFADGTALGADAALFLAGRGIVESFPLPGQRRRWVLRLAPGADATDAAWLAHRIRDRTGHVVDPATNTMLSGFGVRTRLVRSMVTDRAVLIGDAAHEISPIGGQGMNLGWLDAAALAPVLIASLRGQDMTAALRYFERTRLRAARTAARQAEINMALGRPLPAGFLAVRNGLIAAAAGVPAVNSLVARRFTMQ